MNVRLISICAAGLLLLAFLGGTTHAAKRQPAPLDLKEPLDKIVAKLGSFLQNIGVPELVQAIMQIGVNCLTSGGAGADSSKYFVASLMELDDRIRHMNISTHEPKGITLPSLKDYCKRPGFVEVHNFVWLDDHHNNQAEDLLKFFKSSGYPKAYEMLKEFYIANECPDELTDTLPTEASERRVRNSVQKSSHNTKLRELLLTSQNNNPFSNFPLAECNLLTILAELIKVPGIGDLAQLLITLIQEFQTKAALQFLVGKIQEPIKGLSFRELRSMDPIRMFLHEINQSIVNDPTIGFVIMVVEQLLGLDLTNTSLVEVVVSLVELILWRTTAAMPPFVPPTTTALF